MSKFEIGDLIMNHDGDRAIVLDTKEIVLLQWGNGATGTWDAAFFEKVERAYKIGDLVRSVAADETQNVVGVVLDDDGDEEESYPYLVALFDASGEETPFSASELIPWVPFPGELVIESGEDDDDTEGTVVSVDGDFATVLWDGFPFPQKFAIADLEPVDEYEDDFEVGEIVTYSNPIFSGTAQATVLAVEENVLCVAFQGGVLPPGEYSKDHFSKAA